MSSLFVRAASWYPHSRGSFEASSLVYLMGGGPNDTYNELGSRFFRKWAIDSAAAWQPRCDPCVALCILSWDLGALG